MKTLMAQIDSLCLSLSRDISAARLHKSRREWPKFENTLKRVREDSSEAMGLHQLRMNENKKRPVDMR